MMGVPISHQPQFPSNKQTPDFVVSPIVPRESGEWVKLLELKGPEAKLLDSQRHLHRALSPAVTRAIAQVNDYNDSIGNPLNLEAIEKALGYLPERTQRAVLIGRAPSAKDAGLWAKRRDEVPAVKIVTYDEIWREQLDRHSWRRSGYR